jgi:hypothetical protein
VYLGFGMFNFFKSNKCEQCSSLCRDKKVKNPAELSLLIQLIKDEVVKGNLVSLPQMDKGWEGEFSSLTVNPPWPDLILNRFYCSKCNTNFKLIANT